MADENTKDKKDLCPKCGKPLGEIVTTQSGKMLRRCSAGSWNSVTRQIEGCSFVKWLPIPPKPLDEKCPQCGAQLVLVFTRYGKKLKRCSTAGWDKENKIPTGCTYVEWLKGTSQPLDEKCPQCGEPLILYTSPTGKKLKRCSTAGWDKENKIPTGCTFTYWLKPGEIVDTLK